MPPWLELVIAYRDEVQLVVWVALCAASLRWGAGPERAIALALLYILVADLAYHAIFGARVELRRIDVGHAFIDGTACVAMLLIGAHANRTYPLWIGAFQLFAVLAHIARDSIEQMTPLAYVIMKVAPSYFQLIVLAVGLIAHRRRLHKFGTYRSWGTSWPPSWAPGRIVSLLS